MPDDLMDVIDEEPEYYRPRLIYADKNMASVNQDSAQPSERTAIWARDKKGWWIQYSDGTYLMNTWYQDPISGTYYYMGTDGDMLTDTVTPDGYTVDASGAWVQ